MGFLFFPSLVVCTIKIVCLGSSELGVEVSQKEANGVKLGTISDGLSKPGPDNCCSCLSLIVPRARGMCTSHVEPEPQVLYTEDKILRAPCRDLQVVFLYHCGLLFWVPWLFGIDPSPYISLRNVFPSKGWDDSDVVAKVGK